MDIKRFTLIAGSIFVLIGIAGFIPGLTTAPRVSDPSLAIESSYGRLFGLFPVNALHNLVHLAIGLWGLVAARDYASSRVFCKSNAIIYGLLTLMGLFPIFHTTFGLVPIFGHDVWLHAFLTAALAYYGFSKAGARSGIGDRSDAMKTNLRWS